MSKQARGREGSCRRLGVPPNDAIPGNPGARQPTTTCRRINQVERLVAYVTADLLQRSDHRSVQALEADIRNWVKAWNQDPKPFVWTKPAEQILDSLARLLQRTTGAGHQ